MPHKRKKKGQMEIMGLAVVIVLVTFVLIFIVRFAVLKKPEDFKKSFTRAETATNILNTFLETASRDCHDITMTELLQDCFEIERINCNGKGSCKYVNESSIEIFSKTLDSWNIDYYFLAYQEGLKPKIELGKKCPFDKDVKSEEFPIPIAGGVLNVKLDLCG